MTTNTAENYNSVLEKFIGGERLNISKTGNYEMRYHAAAISLNSGGNFRAAVHEAITKKLYYDKNRYKAKQKTTTKFIDADEDDGPNLQTSEIGEKELEDLKKKFMQKLNKTADEIMSISQLTLQQNNSAVWFEERRKRITASSFGKVQKLGYSYFQAVLRFLYLEKKLQPNRKCKKGQYTEFM
ncbi:hypothetical protein ILUMI_03198 [Ignelater luminosus]|uniref:Uncharacterized protein n=1 Tax=Ignelater luminosus TaxID=2038154 RepID=A0A8K0DG92_IGNLU|nr:hypothetical protein ILUMI_03198 [Ignelater luminosus]